MVRILIEVTVADMVMLATDHAAKAREVGLHHVGMLAVAVAVGDAVVDAAGLVVHFEAIPMAGLVGKDHSLGRDAGLGDLDTNGL